MGCKGSVLFFKDVCGMADISQRCHQGQRNAEETEEQPGLASGGRRQPAITHAQLQLAEEAAIR